MASLSRIGHDTGILSTIASDLGAIQSGSSHAQQTGLGSPSDSVTLAPSLHRLIEIACIMFSEARIHSL